MDYGVAKENVAWLKMKSCCLIDAILTSAFLGKQLQRRKKEIKPPSCHYLEDANADYLNSTGSGECLSLLILTELMIEESIEKKKAAVLEKVSEKICCAIASVNCRKEDGVCTFYAGSD
ncbi:hypothetical protein HAX54_038941 [Datura stramonium]|uniref:Uncharacterized protein n=1 Tax=Datura stramonium TaxID=4076 RepID=A0ABS8VLS8_DATST|nr:hypothetical protein [Datura stramonium]